MSAAIPMAAGKMVFAVSELPSGRQSFSPDVSNFTGPSSVKDLRFLQGPPDFAD